MTTREEALRLADALLEAVVLDKHMMQAAALLRRWPDAGEPVGYVYSDSTGTDRIKRGAISVDLPNGTKLYAAPPAAQPAGMVLTDSEVYEIYKAWLKTKGASYTNYAEFAFLAGYRAAAAPSQPAAPAVEPLTERITVLENALRQVLPWVVTQEVACNGLKCREAVCMSCNSDSKDNAQKACGAYAIAHDALATGITQGEQQ